MLVHQTLRETLFEDLALSFHRLPRCVGLGGQGWEFEGREGGKVGPSLEEGPPPWTG